MTVLIVKVIVQIKHPGRHESVSVAQIYLNGGGQRIVGSNLIALNDVNRIAWEGFGQPESGTVFLTNSNQKIVAVENLDDLGKIIKYADGLACLEDKREQEAYIQ